MRIFRADFSRKHTIGNFSRPEQIGFTEALPQTRSGKIMRRLLCEID